MLSQIATPDACMTCGACCANYRVSFYWAEGMNMPHKKDEMLAAAKAEIINFAHNL